MPVTVKVLVPAGVDAVVVIVRVEEQVGIQEAAEKVAVVPEGRPDAEKATDWAVPEVRLAARLVVTVEPWITDTLTGEAVSEKLNGVAFFTVAVTPFEVVRFPAASRATAVSV